MTFIFLVLLLNLIDDVHSDNSHLTRSANHDDGDCVYEREDCRLLRHCPPLLYALLRGKSRPSPDVTALLRERRCGFEGKEPLVCCPKSYPSRIDLELMKLFQSVDYLDLRLRSDGKLPSACGSVHIRDKVVGGSETGLFDFPWMALIGYRTDQGLQHRCGGTLISRRYVLTAAHCVINLKGLVVESVRLGEHDLTTEVDCNWIEGCAEPAKDMPIKRILPHHDYETRTFSNDIALIELAGEVEFTKSVQPVCLPVEDTQRTRNLNGETTVVTGWGATELRTYSQVLRAASVRVIPHESCKHMYRSITSISPSQICAFGVRGQDSCNGDSGGPLQTIGLNPRRELAYVQFGVVSFGPRECGSSRAPGVYTRVSSYVNWILEMMG